MFNTFAIHLLQKIQGKKLVTLLGESTDVTERTWRNRFHKGWNPNPEELDEHRQEGESFLVKTLVREGGWTAPEARKIVSQSPSWLAGVGLPTADLIYWNSPGFGADYPSSIEIAAKVDSYSQMFFEAQKAQDLECARQVVLTTSAWLRTFFPAETDASEVDQLDCNIRSAVDWETLGTLASRLNEEIVYMVMSCWDVEFCSAYFSGHVEAYPLFELLMPRLDPTINVEVGTGRFLRAGQKPRQGIFQKSMSRFLEIVAVLAYGHNHGRLPRELPSVKEMAAWFKEPESRIVSWRDETTKFTLRDLTRIWESATMPNKDGFWPSVPRPLLVAAYLWSSLLVRENGKPKKWYICFDAYDLWWRRNRDRLTAKGLKFGNTPWPAYLTDQPVGNRSPESWRSSQSSGRSSQPLDSQ